MSLQTRLTDLATRIATECKALRTLLNGNAADLSALTTTAKSNLVAALNEVKAIADAASGSGGAEIDDATTSATKVWSSSKTNTAIAAAVSAQISDATTAADKVWSSSKTSSEIASAVSALVNGAGAALDTINELAAALGNDANFAATTAAALAKRVRVDAPQAFNAAEQLQACENLGIGNPDTNFVTTFNAGLV